MTNKNRPFGIDISSYQYSPDGKRKPDFDKLNATVSFCAIRAGISWGYVDKWFRYSWDNVSVPKIAYHVQYPGEDANRQMDHLLRIIPVGEHTRYCLDLELAHGQSKARITQCTLTMLERLRRETGLYPILYSRASWVNQYLSVDDLPEVDWWLANYLRARPAPYFTPEKEPPPILPRGVDRWLIHQTGEKGDGSAVGVVSHYVDTNRWNGSEAELRAYFGLGETEPEPDEPPEVPPSIELYRAKVTATIGLKIRSGAGLNYPQVGSLKYKQEVSVYEEKDGWLRVDPHRQWWSSGEWLERIPDVYPSTMFYGALFGQRDPRWIREPLGTKSTIGAHGCLMTCAAIVAGTNPHELNQWLTANGGYQDGNLFLWAKLEEYDPTLKFENFTWQPTDDTIKAKLTAGIMPILLVDFDERTPMQDMHWVVAIGIDTEGYVIIHDPWTNDILRLRDRYKKPLLRFGSYRRLS